MKKGRVIPYIIELVMRGITAGAVLAAVLGYVYGDGIITLITGLGVCVAAELVFGVVRSITNRFGLFFILHALFTALVVILVPTTAGKIASAVAVCALVADSVGQVKKSFEDGNRLHFGLAFVFIAASYIAANVDLVFIEYSCFVLTAVFMALYFIRTGFYNTQEFARYNHKGSGAPLMEITLRSYTLVCGFGLAVGIFMVAVRYMGGAFIVKHISGAVIAVLSALARWIIFRLQGTEVPVEDAGNENVFNFVRGAFKEKEFPAFVEIIEKLIRYMFIAAIIIGLVAFVVWLIFRLYSNFGHKKRGGKAKDVAQFINPFSYDKTGKKDKQREVKSPSVSKARRYYKKYVVKKLYKKDAPHLSKTPYEISQYLGLGEDKADMEVRRIYEKARYSQDECTKEELKALKEYIKGRVR